MKIQRDKELLDTTKINDQIKNMYVVENKNIMEIGEILNITPGTVACRLVKLKIIEDKKEARFYNEYKESEMYNQICIQNVYKKINNMSNEECKTLHLLTFQTPFFRLFKFKSKLLNPPLS